MRHSVCLVVIFFGDMLFADVFWPRECLGVLLIMQFVTMQALQHILNTSTNFTFSERTILITPTGTRLFNQSHVAVPFPLRVTTLLQSIAHKLHARRAKNYKLRMLISIMKYVQPFVV